MGRYLFLGLAIWAILLIIRHLLREHRLKRQTRQATTKSVDSVQCAYCGLHLPRSEAVHHGADFFCTPEHKKLFIKRG